MRFENIKKTENTVVGRTEIFAKICFDKATPKETEIQDAIAKEFKKDKQLVVIKQISNVFGEGCINVSAHIYKSKDIIKHFEKVEDAKPEEKKETPKEEPKQEKPQEEKKEEAAKPEETPKEEPEKEEKPAEEKKEPVKEEEKKGE